MDVAVVAEDTMNGAVGEDSMDGIEGAVGGAVGGTVGDDAMDVVEGAVGGAAAPGAGAPAAAVCGRDGWRCAICISTPRLAFVNKKYFMKDLVDKNRHLMNAFGLVEEAFPPVEGRNTNFKLYTEHWDAVSASPEAESSSSSSTPLPPDQQSTPNIVMDRRRVFNAGELVHEMSNSVAKGDLKDMCLLCCEEKLFSKLAASPCGHCKNRVCFECVEQWVNQIKPGQVVLPSHLVCPFCKVVPKEKVFRKYNKPAKSLLHKEHLRKVVERMDPGLYYGWCKGTVNVVGAFPSVGTAVPLPS